MNLRLTQNLWLSRGNYPIVLRIRLVGPGFLHLSWVLISAYAIGALRNTHPYPNERCKFGV